jgi:hypothetical protein
MAVPRLILLFVVVSLGSLGAGCAWDGAPDPACPQSDGTECTGPESLCQYTAGYPPGAAVGGYGISWVGRFEEHSCLPMPSRCVDDPTCACVVCETGDVCQSEAEAEDPDCATCGGFFYCVEVEGRPVVSFLQD